MTGRHSVGNIQMMTRHSAHVYTDTGDRNVEDRPGGDSQKIETNRFSVGMRSEDREDNHLNRGPAAGTRDY